MLWHLLWLIWKQLPFFIIIGRPLWIEEYPAVCFSWWYWFEARKWNHFMKWLKLLSFHEMTVSHSIMKGHIFGQLLSVYTSPLVLRGRINMKIRSRKKNKSVWCQTVMTNITLSSIYPCLFFQSYHTIYICIYIYIFFEAMVAPQTRNCKKIEQALHATPQVWLNICCFLNI